MSQKPIDQTTGGIFGDGTIILRGWTVLLLVPTLLGVGGFGAGFLGAYQAPQNIQSELEANRRSIQQLQLSIEELRATVTVASTSAYSKSDAREAWRVQDQRDDVQDERIDLLEKKLQE